MGITIHWRGQLRDPESREAVIDDVQAFAKTKGWKTYRVPLNQREVAHVIDGEVVVRVAPTSGIGVRPHRACEHVVFEFDPQGSLQGSCKTQYAGADIHISVVELLRRIVLHFREFEVHDEGGYWDTQDVRTLIERLGALDRALDAIAGRLEAGGAKVEEAPRYDGPKTIH
jgi:hypothetical protein